MSETTVAQLFTRWRGVSLPDRFIVEGPVPENPSAPSPALARELAVPDTTAYWESGAEGPWLVLVRETARRRERWWLHALLLLLTLVAASLAGAGFAGLPSTLGALRSPGVLRAGLTFSLPLVAILLAHEAGHFVVARWYRVDASPPYFLPLPPAISLIGTLGAFIRLRSPLFDRRTLFDIGIAGPLAGLAVALPVTIVGFLLSHPTFNGPHTPFAHQLVILQGMPFLLGDSLLLDALRGLVAPHAVLVLHPLAIAGWVGLLVTMLNMLPLAQLDGGHIAFALFGRFQSRIAWIFWALLLPLGLAWQGWWLWAALGLAIGFGRLRHPQLISPDRLLSRGRRRLGWCAVALFFLIFMPVPIALL